MSEKRDIFSGQRPRQEATLRLNLDTFPIKTHFGGPDLLVLQVTCADFGYDGELVVSSAGDNINQGIRAAYPLSVLIESKRDIGGIKLPIANPLPGTMPAAEYRMRIAASKESTIRGKGKEVLSHTRRATGCDDPRPD